MTIIPNILQNKSMLSAGEKRDLLVVNFAHAILTTSAMSNVIGREQIPNHKHRNKIMRKCKQISDMCNDIFQKNGYRAGGEWLRSKMASKVIPALVKTEAENPQLESFALYVLYINFFDCRDKKVSSIFDEILKQESELFEILDLIAEARKEEPHEMYKLAINTIEILKG